MASHAKRVRAKASATTTATTKGAMPPWKAACKAGLLSKNSVKIVAPTATSGTYSKATASGRAILAEAPSLGGTDRRTRHADGICTQQLVHEHLGERRWRHAQHGRVHVAVDAYALDVRR